MTDEAMKQWAEWMDMCGHEKTYEIESSSGIRYARQCRKCLKVIQSFVEKPAKKRKKKRESLKLPGF